MDTILEFMGGDHKACDDLFASAEAAVADKNWDSARGLFDRFQAAMAHHLAMEEEVLFPAFEARTGMTMGPTQVRRSEHEQMRDLIASMARPVAPTWRYCIQAFGMLIEPTVPCTPSIRCA